MESLNGRVVYGSFGGDRLASAPVEETSQATRQPLVLGYGIDQRSPCRILPGGALPSGVDYVRKPQRCTEAAEQISPGFRGDPMGGGTDLGDHRPQGRGLGGH